MESKHTTQTRGMFGTQTALFAKCARMMDDFLARVQPTSLSVSSRLGFIMQRVQRNIFLSPLDHCVLPSGNKPVESVWEGGGRYQDAH